MKAPKLESLANLVSNLNSELHERMDLVDQEHKVWDKHNQLVEGKSTSSKPPTNAGKKGSKSERGRRSSHRTQKNVEVHNVEDDTSLIDKQPKRDMNLKDKK